MRERRFGRFVLISSAAGLFGGGGTNVYGVAKMSVLGLMNAIAVEGREHNVLANAVAPLSSPTATDPRYAA